MFTFSLYRKQMIGNNTANKNINKYKCRTVKKIYIICVNIWCQVSGLFKVYLLPTMHRII